MAIAVITEKPAVARDLARVLGATQVKRTYLQGNDYIVSWAIGHLVTLAEPHEISPQWRYWQADYLPMLPQTWPLVVVDKTREQYETLHRLLNSPAISRVICATDAGREGELIFRYIYEAAGSNKPVDRLWLSSLTPPAIRKAMAELRPASHYDGLAAAARGRSRADWLVGMNLSRAYTLTYGHTLSVGRVQTPTLAMVVAREVAIREFVPQDYCQVKATFEAGPGSGASETTYQGLYFDPNREPPPAQAIDRLLPAEVSPEVEKASARRRLPADGQLARAIAERALQGRAHVDSVTSRQHREPPPHFYDLTELQRHANQLFGFTAQHTLDLAQSLYEHKKAITYPRTESRHLSEEIATQLPAIVAAIRGPYEADLAAHTGERPLSKRFVDDAHVGDHHAIVPTAKNSATLELSADEAKIYDLVCRRVLAAWHDDYVYASTSVVTHIVNEARDGAKITDRYRSTGTKVEQDGWKRLAPSRARAESSGRSSARGQAQNQGQLDELRDQALPRHLQNGLEVRCSAAEVLKRQTKPPPRLTDGNLLTAMESAGRALDEKDLSQAMRESGLGTPATRAAIIETLLKREYIARQEKHLVATDKGIALIDVVHPEVKSPIMTGRWEKALQELEHRGGSLAAFIAGIEDYVRDVVGKVVNHPPASASPASGPRLTGPHTSLPNSSGPHSSGSQASPPHSFGHALGKGRHSATPSHPAAAAKVSSQGRPAPAALERLPSSMHAAPPGDLKELLATYFGFNAFRTHQEQICETVKRGDDTLVVMPTGAGKSLCYQLPGIARGGTTLVISPLIALMEDQVNKVQAMGLRAERIHSGRDRLASREVCAAYLRGELDFLFVAPERLGVPGFSEFLAKRKPTLIAIDEAHCISQWGHDFRPDYRLLQSRLSLLRPTPIVALTATATPAVQRDILDQLGCDARSQTFILGFRRSNIAVEVVPMPAPARAAAVFELLKDPARRPAIVYAPTRAKALELGTFLERRYRVGIYHAGLPVQERDEVQERFMTGKLEIIVATVAFGMGIDKSNVRTVLHLALPASVEGYYQEIGRAGRDGEPSRAVLLYSFLDRKTHEFFLRRDYPEPEVLAKIEQALGKKPLARDTVKRKAQLKEETFAVALEKLAIHGGVRIDADETLMAGDRRWSQAYRRQREHKQAQLDAMFAFADGEGCRMLALIRHFGDQLDDQRPCGHCDWCAPAACAILQWRPPNADEDVMMQDVFVAVQTSSGLSFSALAKAVQCSDVSHLRSCLAAMLRAGVLAAQDTTFNDGGREVRYQRYTCTPSGKSLLGEVRFPHVDAPATENSKPRASKRSAKSRGLPTPSPLSKKTLSRRPRSASAQPSLSDALLAALAHWRRHEAERSGKKPFMIASNRVLEGIVQTKPSTPNELLAVHGVGPLLLQRYGSAILSIVNHHGR